MTNTTSRNARRARLSCYSRHRRSYNPLERPGEIDITAHVDFTSLAEAAEKASLRVAGYVDQHHFMVGAAESRLLAVEKAVETGGLASARTAFLGPYRTLMHPGNMGMAFKFLLLAKGLPRAAAIERLQIRFRPLEIAPLNF